MQHGLQPLCDSKSLPGCPQVCRDTARGELVHVYNGVVVPTDRFKDEVLFYVNRKDSPSSNVATVRQLLN